MSSLAVTGKPLTIRQLWCILMSKKGGQNDRRRFRTLLYFLSALLDVRDQMVSRRKKRRKPLLPHLQLSQ